RRSSRLPGRALVGGEAVERGRHGLEQVVDALEAEDLEHLPDLRRQAADLDVPLALADLLDEAHENAEAGRRDVGQLRAVDRELDVSGGNLVLERALELRRGVGIEK